MKIYLIIVLTVAFGINGFSQGAIKKKTKLSDKIFFGGGLGLQFGTITSVEVNPIVGYRPIDKLSIGFKGTYIWYKDSRIEDASTQIYGGSIFTMYNIFERIALYGEFEAISLETEYYNLWNYTNNSRYWIYTPLAGLGYTLPIGDRSKIGLLLLWSFNSETYSPYNNPVVRIMFMF